MTRYIPDSILTSLIMAVIYLGAAPLEAAPVVTQFTISNGGTENVVAADNDNNAVAVINDNGRIKASYLTSGGPWGALTNLTASVDNVFPKVAMDATGTAIAMWAAFSVSPTQVQTAYLTGGVWTTPTPQPLDTTVNGMNSISVAMDGLGNGLGVWSTGLNVRTSFFSAGTWGTVTTIGAGVASNGVIASYSPSGKASALWDNSTNMLASTYNGSVWAAFVNLDTAATGHPDAGIDAAGNTIAVWSSGSGVDNIVSRRFNGTSWDAAQTLSPATGNDVRPKIAVDSDGKAIAVWRDSSNDLQMIKFDGSTWGTPVAIASGLQTNATASGPTITMNAHGNALIGWVTATGQLTNALLPKGGVLQPSVVVTTTVNGIYELDLALSTNYEFDVWRQGLEVPNSFGSFNQFLPLPPDGTDCYSVKSATGELLIDEPTMIAQLKFSYNINTYSADTSTTGFGTITYNSGLATLTSSGSGSATIASKIRAYASSGQGVSSVFAALFPFGDENTSSLAGIGNETDGFFFEWKEGNFGILHRNNSVDTFINRSNWNVDKMDGTGPSGIVLDYTLGNVYKIQYLRLEFGNINFYIESADTGQFILVHQIQYTNNNTVPSLTNPGLQLMAQVLSDGGDISMKLSSMGLYVEGNVDPFLGIRNTVNAISGFDATNASFITIRNDPVFSSITNQLMVIPDELSMLVGSDSASDAIFSLYLNPVLDGTPTFTQVNPNSCVSYSTEGFLIIDGSLIGRFALSPGSGTAINIRDYGIELSPGDILVIASFILGADVSTLYTSISWLEQF